MQIEVRDAEAPEGFTVQVAEVAGGVVTWSVTNHTTGPLPLERVRLRLGMAASDRVRAFLNGWQSWSPSGGSVIGAGGEADPSRDPAAPGLLRAMFHADDAAAPDGVWRSELVTALAYDAGSAVLGFAGGAEHDGTFWLQPGEIVAEAYLGGAQFQPGEQRALHDIAVLPGDPHDGLDRWAAWAGERSGARSAGLYPVGWCSWYHYFHDITEADLRANLTLASSGQWPFDVFQLDDGYQSAIGDWLTRAPAFPTPLDEMAGAVVAAGLRPGIWIAPFLCSPTSEVATSHPDWIVRRPSGRPMIGNVNPAWGGEQYVLDVTRADVQEHLSDVARSLVAMGWTYLKLDFTYAPSFRGEWADSSLTPAERVRAGYDAIRAGAGDDVFLLGCGAPLGPCIGAVDGMRIGPDVAPEWSAPARPFGYADTGPATRNAWRNTLARSFMHRRLWINDPDCLMLRSTSTSLTPAQIEAWAHAVAGSGGMALVSDDLALLGDRERAFLDTVIATGRAVDAASIAGAPPRCPDLLDRWTPARLESAAASLVADPDTGALLT